MALTEAALLREILDAQLEMVCRFMADGTIRYVNRAYAATLGAEPEALTGRNLWDFVTADDRARVQGLMDGLHPDHAELTIENRFETAAGTRWILWHNHALRFDERGCWAEAQSTGFDITERKLLEERTQLLIEELNHRVKNTLMVVQAIAFQTFRGNDMPEGPVAVFNQRLVALAAAHTALSRANWSGAPLEELIRQGLAICGGDSERMLVDGPEVILSSGPTVPLVLILHELATNAIKYGALSNQHGLVRIDWALDSGDVLLTWRESGGPRVQALRTKGFGSRLITDAVRSQLGGSVDLDYAEQGFSCTIRFPVEGLPQ